MRKTKWYHWVPVPIIGLFIAGGTSNELYEHDNAFGCLVYHALVTVVGIAALVSLYH